MINWIEKWLIDRRQRVVVDGDKLAGVPIRWDPSMIWMMTQGVEVCGRHKSV